MINLRPVLYMAFLIFGEIATPNAFAQLPGNGKLLTAIVAQPAGNPTDVMARKLQPVLQRELGETVVVENLPGAGGSIGASKVLRAAIGSPAILMAAQTEVILTPLSIAGIRYKSEDFRPIGVIARAPYVLVSRPDLKAESFSGLVALARRPPDPPLSHGHIGRGSMIHLLGEELAQKLAISLTQVPYRGTPLVIQDLMAAQIDLAFLPLGGNTLDLISTGKLRAYGTTAAVPSPLLPGVLPLSQQSRALRDFIYGTWAAVFVARSTPDAEVARLHAAVSVALRDAEVKSFITLSGSETVEPMSLAELDEFFRTETRLYRQMALEIGIKAE